MLCTCCAFGRHDVYRLPLGNGRHVFMEWHFYFGPSFFRDRACMREIENWHEEPLICAALEWFIIRGKVA